MLQETRTAKVSPRQPLTLKLGACRTTENNKKTTMLMHGTDAQETDPRPVENPARRRKPGRACQAAAGGGITHRQQGHARHKQKANRSKQAAL